MSLVPAIDSKADLDDDDDGEAHLTETCGPLQSEQEAFPGAEVLFILQLRALVSIFVVLPGSFPCGGAAGQLQEEQNRRTQVDQQGQHRAPHRL